MPDNSYPRRRPPGTLVVAGTVIALSGFLVITQSRVGSILLLADGLPAAILIAATILAGTWAVPLLRIGSPPIRWQLLIGAGAGIGTMSMLVLALGAMGLLSRGLWLAVLGVLIIAALGAFVRLNLWGTMARLGAPSLSKKGVGYLDHRSPAPAGAGMGQLPWLWLLVVPFLVITLLVCVVPPGFLWAEEGGGYDVLEYHLQLPREYLEQGGIRYTPHNVYGNFPANVEMLYLLSMIVHGDPYRGAATAKIMNAMLAGLCVLAAYVAGREMSHGSGVVTGVICAGVGWLTYLSGVAYVENGMLMFAMIAMAALVRAMNQCASRAESVAWIRLAGLMSGFACGCKYTAVLLVAAPVGLAVLLMPWPTLASRCRAGTVFALSALVAFSPWLIKNFAMTGNPFFPLANSVFKSQPEGWGQTESHHFSACHKPGPDESTLPARLRLFWQRVPADPDQRFGALVLLLAALRLISRRRTRVDLLLAAMLSVQILAWLFTTHLIARFAVPMIVPLVMLAGRTFDSFSTPAGRRRLTAMIVAGMAINGFMGSRLYARHLYADGRKLPLEGADRFFLEGIGGGHEHLAVINQSLSHEAKILMIGDARAFYFRRRVDYCVVFNRNPFVEAVRKATNSPEIITWLQQRGYTHVLINWAEIRRLRNSRYGFPEEIRPELFHRLVSEGLTPVETFFTQGRPSPYSALYQVPP